MPRWSSTTARARSTNTATTSATAHCSRLRPGESFVREAGNRGLHVNMDVDPTWDGLKAKAPQNDLVYLKDFFPGYRGGVAANGVHRYAPNLAAGDLALGAEVFDNLASGGSPALRVKTAGRPGVLVIPMISPYVYLGGRLRIKAAGRSASDHLTVSISSNNARSFVTIFEGTIDGPIERKIDLKENILRRYACWLRIELDGAAGLNALEIDNDFQHAPRTLPWLARGKTRSPSRLTAIRRSPPAPSPAGSRPTHHSPRTRRAAPWASCLITFNLKHDACWWKGGTGSMTVPIEVPGDLVSLGFSAQIRVRSDRDRVRVTASTNNGRTWREVTVMNGPTQGRTGHFRVGEWPRGTRNVLLRFDFAGNNTVGVQHFRVDADYRDPMAAKSVRPFRVVHRWTEGGKDRSHTENITRLPATYSILPRSDPEMVSVSYEMPASR